MTTRFPVTPLDATTSQIHFPEARIAFGAAPQLHAALVSAMSAIPNPDDAEDSRADSLDEYSKWWAREMHKTARAAFAAANS